MKLTNMYYQWSAHLEPGRILNPLGNVLWIERTFGYTYRQSRHLFVMFWKRLLTEMAPNNCVR